MKLAFRNIRQYFSIGLSSKWRPSADKDVYENSHGPVITRLSVPSSQHLGSNVVRSSIRLTHELVFTQLLRQPKINQFDRRNVFFVLEKKVLRFQISVTDALSMTILEGRDDLSHDLCCVFFSEMFGLRDVEEQFSSRTQLSDKKTYSCGLPCLIQFDDVRMILKCYGLTKPLSIDISLRKSSYSLILVFWMALMATLSPVLFRSAM